jgi:pre-peptidase
VRHSSWALALVLLAFSCAACGFLPHTDTIIDSAFTVSAMSSKYYGFEVPTGATGIRVDGHFAATGGTGNDIQVLVLSEDDFVNWQNGHPASACYDSGKVTQSTITATLPGPGTYYLVFSNTFSLLTPKAVQARASVHYRR